MQQGRICILGKIEFSVDNGNAGKNAKVMLYFMPELKVILRHLKTIKNKRNLNTKWLLLQNDQNADTTLLHSHDELILTKLVFQSSRAKIGGVLKFGLDRDMLLGIL